MVIAMQLQRVFRHFSMTRWRFASAFPRRTLKAVEDAITRVEQTHGGELRFVAESELSTGELLRNVSPRERALRLFGELGVWDTANNNGVLIYVSLADRDVEIVADRGYVGKVSDAEWADVCHAIEVAYRSGDFERGTLAGIDAASALMARSYPEPDGDELPNAPVVA
jgi:uncharacterized membrane protein